MRLMLDSLGHRNSQHTVRYTAANPAWVERLWRICMHGRASPVLCGV